jgi:hypothetical protein
VQFIRGVVELPPAEYVPGTQAVQLMPPVPAEQGTTTVKVDAACVDV